MLRRLAAALGVSLIVLSGGAASGQQGEPLSTAALVARAEANRQAGRFRAAFADYEAAVAAAVSPSARRYALAAQGVAQFESGLPQAETTLRAALRAPGDAQPRDAQPRDVQPGDAHDDADLVARAFLARLLAASGRGPEALRLAEDALAAATPPLLSALALSAKAVVLNAARDDAGAAELVRQALAALSTAPPGDARDGLLIGAAEIAADVSEPRAIASARAALASLSPPADLTARAERADARARLALAAGDPATARRMADNALSAAQASGRDDLAFRVSRRRAAIALALSDETAALAAARSAFASLRAVRDDFVNRFDADGRSLYRAAADGFHAQLVDLLLRRHDVTGEEALLREARLVIEDLKVFEVEDYYRERCVQSDNPVALEDVGRDVAVVFPLLLTDRVEIIVSRGGRLSRGSSDTPAELVSLLAEAAAQRVSRFGPDSRVLSRRLHDVLINPIEHLLEGADTLVYAPDGVLRRFPVAALWDGEHYLVERFDVANVLGLTLINASPLRAPRQALVAAASVTAVPGFAEIPGAAREASQISALLRGELLLDDAFTVERAAERMSRPIYDVVHIAAHAQFGVEPSDNFIAVADGRLDLDTLVTALRARAIEGDGALQLLTLSACETAEGTDRAPLGLAGAAYRAQASSVLASLWLASDEATVQLMQDVYANLFVDGMGRAAALGAAQRALISEGGAFANPAVWAPFILLGDWR